MNGLDQLHAHSPRYTPLGLFLALAMFPALAALALDERLFQGVPVWTKPLKFLFALVVYLLTLAWMARFAEPSMTRRAWWRWHERAVVVAVLAGLEPPSRKSVTYQPPPFNWNPAAVSIF